MPVASGHGIYSVDAMIHCFLDDVKRWKLEQWLALSKSVQLKYCPCGNPDNFPETTSMEEMEKTRCTSLFCVNGLTTYIRAKLSPIDETEWIRGGGAMNVICITDWIQKLLMKMFEGMMGVMVVEPSLLDSIDDEAIMKKLSNEENLEENKEEMTPKFFERGATKRKDCGANVLRRSLRCQIKRGNKQPANQSVSETKPRRKGPRIRNTREQLKKMAMERKIHREIERSRRQENIQIKTKVCDEVRAKNAEEAESCPRRSLRSLMRKENEQQSQEEPPRKRPRIRDTRELLKKRAIERKNHEGSVASRTEITTKLCEETNSKVLRRSLRCLMKKKKAPANQCICCQKEQTKTDTKKWLKKKARNGNKTKNENKVTRPKSGKLRRKVSWPRKIKKTSKRKIARKDTKVKILPKRRPGRPRQKPVTGVMPNEIENWNKTYIMKKYTLYQNFELHFGYFLCI